MNTFHSKLVCFSKPESDYLKNYKSVKYSWGQSYKTFYGRNKLEFLSLARLSNLIYCLWVRLEPTQMEHLSGSPL
jgi:hypothetical protein